MAARKTKAVSKAKAKTDLTNYEEPKPKGFENQGQDDFITPMLNILQTMTPSVEEGNEKAGDIWNNGAEASCKEVLFVPATTQQVFIEWIPLDKGGGLVAIHEPTSEVVIESRAKMPINEMVINDGNDLVQTFQVYGIICNADGDPEGFAMIPMTSTKIKKYKAWMHKMRTFRMEDDDGRPFTPDMFRHLWRLTTVKEKNKVGQSYYNWEMTPAEGTVEKSLLDEDDPRAQMGEACYDAFGSGKLKVVYEGGEESAGEPSHF